MVHRPLSEWVTVLPVLADGSVRWDPGREVNFGDERADARHFPQFAQGWHRQAVPVDLGYEALGLISDSAPSAVIELGDVATPIRVTRDGANVIARFEEDWPGVVASGAESAVLAREGADVRYLLLTRLAAEGQPDPAMFHILPWELVDQLATEVDSVLGGTEPPPRITVLGHWFTPAGSRITAALEQLDQGLRDQDPETIRVAATALCVRALDADVAKFPPATRQALARLVARLPGRDRFLEFTAVRAARRLAGADPYGLGTDRPLRLDARLPAAADSEVGIRHEATEAVREPYVLRLTVTATGRAEVSLRAETSAQLTRWLTQAYGVLLQPVIVSGASGPTRYLIPLQYSDREVSGRLSLAITPGPAVETDLAGPPIGSYEALQLTAAEVERSIRALRSRSARALWGQVAATLPAAHPLRAVIARETQ